MERTEELQTLRKRKRGQRNETEWVQNKKKQARNFGKAYFSVPGKALAERRRLDGCGGSGSYKYMETLSVRDRNHRFELYCSLGDHSRQSSYIS